LGCQTSHLIKDSQKKTGSVLNPIQIAQGIFLSASVTDFFICSFQNEIRAARPYQSQENNGKPHAACKQSVRRGHWAGVHDYRTAGRAFERFHQAIETAMAFLVPVWMAL
jgi:hypothetical protein